MAQGWLADRLETARVGAEDARRRFEAAERRLEDFRSRARGLATALGAVVAIEANVASKLLEKVPGDDVLRVMAQGGVALRFLLFGLTTLTFATALAYQVVLLGRAVRLGYGTTRVRAPGEATEVAGYLREANPLECYTALLNDYAEATTAREDAGFDVGRKTGDLAKEFTATLWLLLLVLASMLVRALFEFVGVV